MTTHAKHNNAYACAEVVHVVHTLIVEPMIIEHSAPVLQDLPEIHMLLAAELFLK